MTFDFRSFVTNPFSQTTFFNHKLQGNAWLRRDLSLNFPKFQFWPCTSNYRTENWFHKLKLLCWYKLRAKNFHLLGSPQQWHSSPCSETEMLKLNLKKTQKSTTATKSWNFIFLTGTFWSAKDQILLWNPSGFLCSAAFTSLKHVLLIQGVLSPSLTSIKFKLSRKTWKSTLILISSARNKPGYQEFKPHTAQMNAAAYNIQQGWVFVPCEGWMSEKGKRLKKCIYLKHLSL